MKTLSKSLLVISAVMLLLVMAACGSSGKSEEDSEQQDEPPVETETSEGDSGDEVRADWPKKLNIGVVPSEDQTSATDRVNEFAKKLGEHLDVEVDVFLGTDYNAVIEAMRTKNIDIAFFGPFAYVLASERSGAEVFSIGGKSEDDITYTSAVIVPKESNAETLDDLKGKDFLFVDPASASGHIFPRAKVMEEMGVTNEEVETVFGNVTFSGSHDASILAIVNGDADGAAVATDVLGAMLEQGIVSEDDYKVLVESDPIPRGPDAYRKDLPEGLKKEIREFYFGYEDEDFFEERGINGFYPVEDKAFDVVRQAAESLGMSPEELLK